MSAVFSAGVLAKLQEQDIYSEIDAVYAVSAGALNGAFFLSRQADLLEQVYCEALPASRAINTANLWSLWQQTHKDVFAVDRALDMLASRRLLDDAALYAQPIPLFAKVYNVGRECIEYLDVREQGVLQALHATTCIAPFYTKDVFINDQQYIDGAVREAIGLQYLLEKHPGKQIIIIRNAAARTLRHLFHRFVHRSILRALPESRYYSLFRAMEEGELSDLRAALREQRILVVEPPPEFAVGPATTDKRIIKQGYEMGVRAADRVQRFLDRQALIPMPLATSSSEAVTV